MTVEIDAWSPVYKPVSSAVVAAGRSLGSTDSRAVEVVKRRNLQDRLWTECMQPGEGCVAVRLVLAVAEATES